MCARRIQSLGNVGKSRVASIYELRSIIPRSFIDAGSGPVRKANVDSSSHASFCVCQIAAAICVEGLVTRGLGSKV